MFTKLPSSLVAVFVALILAVGLYYFFLLETSPSLYLKVPTLSVQPKSLSFDAKLDEQVTGVIDVECSEDIAPNDLKIDFHNFAFDRKIVSIAKRHLHVIVGPATVRSISHFAAEMDMSLKDSSTKTYNVSLTGRVQPWINIEPSIVNLGVMLLGNGSMQKNNRLSIVLSSTVEDWKIKNVVIDGLVGITSSVAKAEPKTFIGRTLQTNWQLDLSYDPNQFLQKSECSTILRGEVLVQTSIAESPFISIPIIGLVSHEKR